MRFSDPNSFHEKYGNKYVALQCIKIEVYIGKESQIFVNGSCSDHEIKSDYIQDKQTLKFHSKHLRD